MDVNLRTSEKRKWGRIWQILPLFIVIVAILKCVTEESNRSDLVIVNEQYIRFQYDRNKDYKVIIEGDNDQQQVLGSYKKTGNGYMGFKPAFPFTPGQTYEVIEDGEDYLKFTPKKAIKPAEYPPTSVVNFYPEVDTVPENLLKMYITFSRPIDATQNIYDHLTVYDTSTREVREIFLKLENELWNQDRTEVTLWIDPGRVKKDLIPNQQLGNPLLKRRTYEILVVENLRDINGERIASARKRITVGERDEVKPDIQNWTLTPPAKATKESLGIGFHESLDAKLFVETTRIYNSENQEIKGSFLMGKNAKSALFIPEQTWQSGQYTMEVESRLEDLAGNNLNRLFDVDLKNRGEVSTSKVKKRSFVIK
jgi:hypothetical protein